MSLRDQAAAQLKAMEEQNRLDSENAVAAMRAREAEQLQAAKTRILDLLSDASLLALIEKHARPYAHRVAAITISEAGVMLLKDASDVRANRFSEFTPIDQTLKVDPLIARKAFNAPEVQARVENLRTEQITVAKVADQQLGHPFVMLIDYTKVK